MIEQLILYNEAILKALLETLILVGISSLIGLVFGLVLGIIIYLTHPRSLYPNPVLSSITNLYVNVVRSFPFLIFIVMLFPITRMILGKAIGTIPAIFPLSLVSIAIFARFVEQALMDVPKQIVDTGIAMGTSLFQLLRHFLLPSARQSLVMGYTSTIISTLSYSTVVGVVGGGGIGDFAFRYGYQSFNYPLMYALVLIIIVFVQIIQIIGKHYALPKGERK